MNLHRVPTFLLLLSVLLWSACGHDHDDEHGSVEDEGCEHMQDGPNKAVSAAAEVMSAPDATAEHTRIDVSLVDVTDGKGGSVQFIPDEAGEFYLFLSADVPVKLTKASDGAEVTAEVVGGAIAQCSAAIPKHYVFDLEASTYILSFGPTTEPSVRFVFEAAGEHSEDGHEH